ncbi:MAG: type II toxin-antitoxin system prevent-host-death family antitoxin [Burkholderiales bacterium]
MARTRDSIAISKFKATCLAVLERVRRTGRPVLVTKFGEPIAEIVPPPPPPRPRGWLGSFADRARIRGDVVEPAAGPEDWEALKA